MTPGRQNGIPKSWAFSTLGEISEKPEYGWTTSAAKEGDLRLLRTTDLSGGTVDWDSVPFCSENPPNKDRYKLRRGDIVISRAGSVGFSFLIGDCPEAVFASYLIRFRPFEEIHQRYLSYFLQSSDYWQQIKSSASGIALQNVNAKKLAAIVVPVAPEPEQARIVAEIEKLFTRLEAGVEGLKRIQANLKRYRAAVLKAAVEGRLVPTEAELARREGRSYEPASELLKRILAERRARWGADQLAKFRASRKEPTDDKWKVKYKEPSGPDVAIFPALPESWVWATIDQLVALEPNSITDGPFGSNLKTEHYTAEGPRVVRLQNIGDGVFIDEKAHVSPEHFFRLEKHRVESGDIVIAALGDRPPRSCVIPESLGPAIVKADCIRFKPEPRAAIPKYLNYALNAEPTKTRTAAIVHGVGRPRLNLGEIKGVVLPLPPLTEQKRIVAEAERRLSVIDELELQVEANLKRAERLREAILKRAFEGKLVPQNPDDEPASILLQRIRAEQEAR